MSREESHHVVGSAGYLALNFYQLLSAMQNVKDSLFAFLNIARAPRTRALSIPRYDGVWAA